MGGGKGARGRKGRRNVPLLKVGGAEGRMMTPTV